MRTLALLSLALLGGCWYDRPNPWRTEGDMAELRWKTEHDWILELREPYVLPRNDGVAMTLPDLEGWRDSVLANADAAVLTHMRDESIKKIAGLETRAYSMAPMTENNKTQIYELVWQARVEKLRLGMIDARLGSVGR
ncbi:MAG TPA: hypothetical protein VM222_01000 [Planctomycetota bacterium]|nr:hypothetical protein [Planctomycetota bacterium]